MIQVNVALRVLGRERAGYEALFLVDTGATDSMAPGSALRAAGIEPVGKTSYELANGDVEEYPFGLAQIEVMGEVTAGRVFFGPEGMEPLLGGTALESVGLTIDPANRTLKRLPAIPLKVCTYASPHSRRGFSQTKPAPVRTGTAIKLVPLR